MAARDLFHPDFTPTPYWWEAYRPTADPLAEVPKETRVAIVGGGYAGLSAALELAKHGLDAVVLEARELGFGASTRNGGSVSGGVNLGKGFGGRSLDPHSGRVERIRGCKPRPSKLSAIVVNQIVDEDSWVLWPQTSPSVLPEVVEAVG
ncbi:MAG: FAD-dependent oxidoreductase, partial [Stellaceae bacterium]